MKIYFKEFVDTKFKEKVFNFMKDSFDFVHIDNYLKSTKISNKYKKVIKHNVGCLAIMFFIDKLFGRRVTYYKIKRRLSNAGSEYWSSSTLNDILSKKERNYIAKYIAKHLMLFIDTFRGMINGQK